MRSSRPIRVLLLSSLAIALAASAVLVPATASAAAPGSAACQEYSVCGGPTGPAGGGRASAGGGPTGSQRPAPPDTSGWVRLPLVDYPVTPAVAILAASLLGAGAAIWLAVRSRKRPRAAARPL